MSRSLSVLAADDTAVMPDCANYWLCHEPFDWFGLDWPAENARVLVATPARTLLVVLLATVARATAHRAIRRLTDRTATGAVPTILRPLRNRVVEADVEGQITERRTQRAEVIGVEQITSGGVFLRFMVRATNADQWRVGRELRMRLEERFIVEGIRTPLALLTGMSGTAAGPR